MADSSKSNKFWEVIHNLFVCSTSSRVKTLVGKSVLPSPARHKDHMTSSTPMPSSKMAASSGGGHMTMSESKESTSFPASSTPKVRILLEAQLLCN